MQLASKFPETAFRVLATDRDTQLLGRARRACYRRSSLRELPEDWIARAFEGDADEWCLKVELGRTVTFEVQDLRRALPSGPFRLVLCRNMAFSYFDDREQRRVLRDVTACLKPGGYLVIGAHEQLPEGQTDLRQVAESRCIYQFTRERASHGA
jgi:chemotaxis protein methyltransferase CheR